MTTEIEVFWTENDHLQGWCSMEQIGLPVHSIDPTVDPETGVPVEQEIVEFGGNEKLIREFDQNSSEFAMRYTAAVTIHVSKLSNERRLEALQAALEAKKQDYASDLADKELRDMDTQALKRWVVERVALANPV